MMQIRSFNPLPCEFYTRSDVVQVAKDLLGKILYTSFDNEITSGIITETEAYAGAIDRASHAYNKRRTARTEIMYMEGGCAYVYLCYGIHSLFNVVTSVHEDPHAVLIRGIEPLHGIEIMKNRTGKSVIDITTGTGPGNVSKLLGIRVVHSGVKLYLGTNAGREIWIQDEGIKVMDTEVKSGPRIGVSYAGEDAFLPFRFQWKKKSPW